MTLRVEISIIPFGNEDEKRVIETLNISNILPTPISTYVIERNSYKKYDEDTPRVTHSRTDGALVLVRKAIEALGA